MAIITVARQVGSGGQSIAVALAERLGYRLYDRHALRQAASHFGLSLPATFEAFARDDRPAVATGSTLPRLYMSYGELEFDQAIRGRDVDPGVIDGPSFLDTLSHQRREILLTLQAVVYRLAAQDRVVFVGAGTQILLAQAPRTLRVKVVAAESVRAERLSTTYGLPLDEARLAVAQADQEQRDYNTAIYGADWDDPLMWDAVINSSHLTVELASEWIAGLVGHSPYEERLDKGIATALRTASDVNLHLLQAPGLRTATIVAVPVAESVALRGEAANQSIRDEARRIAAKAAPRVNVQDEITPAGDGGLLGEW